MALFRISFMVQAADLDGMADYIETTIDKIIHDNLHKTVISLATPSKATKVDMNKEEK